jgi:hypothetical protein
MDIISRAYQRMATAMLQRAVIDAENGNIEAALWLADRDAENWGDMAGIDRGERLQQALLLATGHKASPKFKRRLGDEKDNRETGEGLAENQI